MATENEELEVIEEKPADVELEGEVTPDEGGDERIATHEDDEKGHLAETNEEAEARKERNRKRRAENKDRRKEYVDSLKRELASRDELLAQAMERLDAVERRTHSADISAVDNEIKKTADAYNYFKNQISIAVQAGNGEVVADATEKMQQAQRRFDQLNGIKEAVKKQSEAAPPLDPRLKQHAEAFLEKHNWYDPQAKDQDSRMLRQIDIGLSEEGWNPSTEGYWTEMESRMKKYLPHRINSGYNREQRGRSSPVAGSGREDSGSKGNGTYRLSAERVQALKDAGLYEDPKARAEAIKRFQTYDKEHAQ